MVSPSDIVAKAREYVGTPFHHQGRLKGVGVDCIGLLTGVATELDLTHHDFVAYRTQPDGVTLIRELERGGLVQTDDELLPGRVAVFWIKRPDRPMHAGIIASKDRIIHTWYAPHKVVEHVLNDWWHERICRVYEFPGVKR